MTWIPIRSTCVRRAVVCLTLLDAACSTAPPQAYPVAPPRPPVPLRKIVQLDFGRAARFAVCNEPPCPSATPKTAAEPDPTRSRAAKPNVPPAGAPAAPRAARPDVP
jgi:hypothetical protein